MSDPDDGITITADGATIMASEKVSTGQYENGQVSTTLELSIEGADLSDGVPQELQDHLRDIRADIQRAVKYAAEERKDDALGVGGW